jgi:hypothetical protein
MCYDQLYVQRPDNAPTAAGRRDVAMYQPDQAHDRNLGSHVMLAFGLTIVSWLLTFGACSAPLTHVILDSTSVQSKQAAAPDPCMQGWARTQSCNASLMTCSS